MRFSDLIEIIDMDTELCIETERNERYIYPRDWDISEFENNILRSRVLDVRIEDGVLVIDIEKG